MDDLSMNFLKFFLARFPDIEHMEGLIKMQVSTWRIALEDLKRFIKEYKDFVLL
jgi:hypothetical protein